MVRRPPNTLCVSPSISRPCITLPCRSCSAGQLKDLGVVKGYENAVAPISVGQAQAERMLDELLDSVQVSSANIPDDFQIESHAFHIPASKGLIAASRYARHLVVGSRGLSGLDAHFLGSVSKQIINFADCTVTVVH